MRVNHHAESLCSELLTLSCYSLWLEVLPTVSILCYVLWAALYVVSWSPCWELVGIERSSLLWVDQGEELPSVPIPALCAVSLYMLCCDLLYAVSCSPWCDVLSALWASLLWVALWAVLHAVMCSVSSLCCELLCCELFYLWADLHAVMCSLCCELLSVQWRLLRTVSWSQCCEFSMLWPADETFVSRDAVKLSGSSALSGCDLHYGFHENVR